MNRWIILTATAVLASVLNSCAPQTEKPEVGTQKVHLAAIHTLTRSAEVASFGSLAFVGKADLSTQVEGTVVQPIPDEGTRVAPGQTILVLENIQLQIQKHQAQKEIQTAQASLELSKAKLWEARSQFETRRLTLEKTQKSITQKQLELEDAEKTLKGKEKLYTLEGISEQDLSSLRVKVSSLKTDLQALESDLASQKIGLRDKDILAFGLKVPSDPDEKEKLFLLINTTTAEAEVHAAEVSLAKAQDSLSSIELLESELTLRSPLEGVIGARYVERGEHVAANTKAATVFDGGTIDAVVKVREEEGLQLSPGLSAKLWIDALGSDPLPGRVRIVSPLVDPTSGQFTVKVKVDSHDKRLKPGLFVRVVIPYGAPRKQLMVPLTALVEKRNEDGTVFSVVNRRLILRKVKLGPEEKGEVPVLEGLAENDQVVDSPSPLLKEADRVEIQK